MNPLKIINYIRQHKITKEMFCKMCNINLHTLDCIIYYGTTIDFEIAERISLAMGVGVYELYM